jgi:hypothetical protein
MVSAQLHHRCQHRQWLRPHGDAYDRLLLERQDLPCTYLAPHEPESIGVIIVIVSIIIIIIKVDMGADKLLDHCRMAISSDRL